MDVVDEHPIGFEIREVGDATVVTFKGDNMTFGGTGFRNDHPDKI